MDHFAERMRLQKQQMRFRDGERLASDGVITLPPNSPQTTINAMPQPPDETHAETVPQ